MNTRCWSINGRFLTQSITGVQRYAREILCALDGLMGEGHPLAQDLKLQMIVPPGTVDLQHLRFIPIRAAGRFNGHLWEQASLPASARRGLLSLCNTGPIAVRKQILCIHDANTRLCPASYAMPFRMLYRGLQPALGRTAMSITTVSQFSAAQLAGRGIAPISKISVVPNGHEHVLRWHPQHTPATRAAAGPTTIVVIGSPAPHKNFGLILELATRLGAVGLRVAVAGLQDRRVFMKDNLDRERDSFVWLGRISDDALAALLRDSLCLAFPSFAEGFGLPPLEAMALGCPVVAANSTSLPEICGEAALYAPPESPSDWLTHFLRLREDPQLRSDLISRGLAQARRFSWRKSALTYLELMARADGRIDPHQVTP